ncbi:hypothetical protein [carnivorous sponge associated iridovirus]|nr:hypothetical protein [carnivorous sponge associated iridovirus]
MNMNAINCTLTPVYNEDHDASILYKMRIFGIVTPDEDRVTLKGRDYYCVTHTRTPFNEESLMALDSEEAISDSTKKDIKTQYMKIRSFAFLFGIGRDCVRDKYNRLIPIDMTPQDQRNILENNNGIYSPHLVSEITEDVYKRLDKLDEYEIINSDQKWDLISKYQDQLDHDDLILEELEVGTCCCCGGPCNPCSQACGACPRNGRLMAWGLGIIDQDGKQYDYTSSDEGSDDPITNTSNTEVDIYHYNDEEVCLLKDVINLYKDQFKGCLDPKKAVVKKNIPHCIVSRHKKQWVPCVDVKERKAKILISVTWVRANILGFPQ